MADQATLDRARRPPPPRATEQLPQWVTLREAAFITDLDELTLRSMVASGVLGADRSLSKRMGERYVLIRSADMEAAGLLPSQRSAQAWPPDAVADLTALPPAPDPTVRPDPVVRMPEAASAPSPAQDPPPPAPPPATVEAQFWGPQPEAQAEAPLPWGSPHPAPSPSLWDPATTTASPAVEFESAEESPLAAVRTWARSVARSLVLGLAAGLFLVTLGAVALGYRGVAITSGAMEPAVHRGDLAVTRPVSPDSVRVGDVVSFHDPAQRSRVLVQRVQRIEPVDGAVRFVTRADAGTGSASFSVAEGGRVRVVRHRLPVIGGLASFVRRNSIGVGVAALVVAVAVARLRRRRRVPLIRALE